ncbi:homocysteine S-methyltransferase family protein [Aspergillus tubingensis]|uniref:homocysteine S-methyltransferase family protein n=1 Tax=Aspergillus tubingensis TaxID=5068 RepID=UPI001578CBA4|nr:homocysteine S-methyltransferase [Aspergillus tubingensis]GFN12676.1 homocysteine S-methyltransferase [Aspergillus tubingensis]GLA95082.1 catalyzes methyl transfer from S-methylmethionine (SMM) to adenosyl-L-homocysteine (AdoMet) [Aspergillus tubingensis]GLB19624.1 catalyzes methyl transfer from S-methylmethionine (SMM) to adenosyl-L-homocysteine (AdoMet) [Aspergillus tubingensis]
MPPTPILILDGGLGTSLQDHYNITFSSDTTPLWSSHLMISDPKTLLSCQRDFTTTAAVDVLLTATYQVSPEGFQRTKTPSHPSGIPRASIAPYLRTALDVAGQAVQDTSASVALSLGPYGACMIPGQEYSGKYDGEHDNEEKLWRWHTDRLGLFDDDEAMEGKGLRERVKYIAMETVPRIDEVRAVRRAVGSSKGFCEGLPFWVACVFPVEDKDTLPDGSTVDEVVEAMLLPVEGGATPWGIGINCTKLHKLPRLVGLFGDAVERLLREGRIQERPALVLYPDGTQGEVYNTTTQTWEKVQDKSGADDSRPWEVQLSQVVNDAAATGQFSSILVGGCCKASFNDIKRLREQLRPE